MPLPEEGQLEWNTLAVEEDPAGQQIARSIGEEGQSWAARTIRNDDIDVYSTQESHSRLC
jgi:hypothetical protein